jgi:hypothetical protein
MDLEEGRVPKFKVCPRFSACANAARKNDRAVKFSVLVLYLSESFSSP